MTFDLAAVLRGTNALALRVLPDGRTVSAELLPGDLQRDVASVQTDSRVVGPGDLFVALSGQRVDGHEFAGEALRRGARYVLAHRIPQPYELQDIYRSTDEEWSDPRCLLLVPNTLVALQRLARSWRLSQSAEVIGITGSVGKTSTKEVIYSLLSQLMPALRSEANLNTEIGLPLTLLRLRPSHRVAILEMGMHQPGDISLLARVACPRIGIVTNVGPVHLERMGTIKRIARAKSELVAALPPDGLAVLNGDDEWTRAMAQTSGVSRTMLIGFGKDCDYQATDVQTGWHEGTTFTVRAEGKNVRFHTAVPGMHFVHAYLSAIAVARELGIGWSRMVDAVAHTSVEGRQQILDGQEGLLIIDDSYNAAPASMTAALKLLAAAPGAKIAVLGDMLELGPHEEEAHLSVGREAADVAEWLIVCGSRSNWIAQGAINAGLPEDRIIKAATNKGAIEAVKAITGRAPFESTAASLPTMHRAVNRTDHATADWSVLVKGSRGMQMEEVVHGLRSQR